MSNKCTGVLLGMSYHHMCNNRTCPRGGEMMRTSSHIVTISESGGSTGIAEVTPPKHCHLDLRLPTGHLGQRCLQMPPAGLSYCPRTTCNACHIRIPPLHQPLLTNGPPRTAPPPDAPHPQPPTACRRAPAAVLGQRPPGRR